MTHWKEIPSIPGYYANDKGMIRGKSGRILSLKMCKRGYLFFGLTGGLNISVARAVCEAFHGYPKGLHVDHINRIRNDNRPENLRWVTRSENLRNRVFHSGEAHCMSKLTAEQVEEIKSSSHYRGFDGVMALKFGVSRETVRDVRNGKQRVRG